MKFYITTSTYDRKSSLSRAQIYNGKHCRSVAEFNVWHLCTILNGEVAVPAQLIDLELSARTSRGDFNQQKLYKPPTHTTEYHK